jgi:Uma2 family endonuclease
MATQPLETGQSEAYLDDSQYERFDGNVFQRPVPGLDHAELQRRMVDLLLPFQDPLGGKVLQEWSISDGSGDWLTPDITFSYAEIQTTRRGHLLAPARLVVEIRSPDQPLKTLFEKWERYRRWRIPHYWIVDPIEIACYECGMTQSAVLVLSQDMLRAGEIELSIDAIFKPA